MNQLKMVRGTSITDPRVLLKEGEFRCNIDDLTSLDVEVTHNNQGEGEIVMHISRFVLKNSGKTVCTSTC